MVSTFRGTAGLTTKNAPRPAKAKLFMNGRSQAVRLPKEFQFSGKEVNISRDGDKVILEPAEFDLDAWFARLQALREAAGPFMPEGRDQPAMPPDRKLFDE
jgi:antitoxin VapB